MSISKYKYNLTYVGLNYINTFLNVGLNLLLIKILSLYDFGIISLGKSIFQSFEFSHLGIRFGMDRLLPDENDQDNKVKLYSVSYIFSIISSLVFCLFWTLCERKDNLIYFLPFILGGLLYTLSTITKIYYRALNNKSSFIRIAFWIGLFPLLSQFLGCLIIGFKGYLWGFIVGYIVSSLIINLKYKIKISFCRKDIIEVLSKLFPIGFPLFLSALLSFLVSSGDRFFINHFWGTEMVGLLGIAMFFFSAINVFANSYTEMIMSNIIKIKSFIYILRHIIIVLLITSVMVCCVSLLLPVFLKLLLPQYLGITNAIRIMLITSIPMSILPILNNFMNGLDKRKALLILNFVSSTIYIIVLVFFLRYTNQEIYTIIWIKVFFYSSLALSIFIQCLYYKRKQSCL